MFDIIIAAFADIIESMVKARKLIVLLLSIPFVASNARLGAQSSAYYQPKPVRLEMLQSWEKAEGRALPENVPGIYELDYRRYDFQNNIALTIDDCMPNHVMATDLDILKRRGIKAVFFIIGHNFVDSLGRPMPRAKELLTRVVEEGHVIGDHSYWHRRLDLGAYRDNRVALTREIDGVQALVDRILGHHYPIIYFRPPGGAHSTPLYALDRVLKEKREYLANWTITSFDWCMRLPAGRPDHLDAATVLARTVKQAKEESGGVVIVHAFPQTAAILDELLTRLMQAENSRGPLRFTTLDEIMRLKPVFPK